MAYIDVHTHGICGFDTKDASTDDILKIAEIHAKHGVTGFLATIYPRAVEKMRNDIDAVKNAIAAQRKTNIFQASKILGVHLEGPFLNKTMAGRLDPSEFLEPTHYNLKRLLDGFEDVIKTITIAPELEGALAIIHAISDMGITASMGHSYATYTEAESGFHAGARCITHIFNAMRGIHHREPGIAGFGLINQDVFVEIIADTFHLSQTILEMIFRLKNPERIIIVSDSIRETGIAREGIVNKNGRLSGGSMTIMEAADRLIRLGFDKDLIMNTITHNPEDYILKSVQK